MPRALGLTLGLVAAACSEPPPPPSPADAGRPVVVSIVATCAEVHGEAQMRRTGRPYWEPLTEGGTLRDGDWVRTLAGGRARLEFVQGGSLELSEKAVVVVELPEPGELPAGVAVTSPRVSVESGEVHARLAKGAADVEAAPLIVRTPDGKTTVLQPAKTGQATEFRLNATDGGLQVAVLTGAAVLKSGELKVQVPAGSAAVVTGEGPAPAVVELPVFPASVSPGIDARLVFEEGVSQARLQWAAVPRATGYRVQVARDLSFTVQSRTIDVSGTSWPLKAESKGMYAWRVATRGTGGLLGEFGFARRIFFEADEPKEHLLGPEDAATVPYAGALPAIQFTWLSAAQGVSYRLLISKGGDPQTEPLVNVTTTAQRVEVSTLPAGEYRWGVYADGKVLKPLFLKPRRLVVKAVPRAVVKTPNKINKWE